MAANHHVQLTSSSCTLAANREHHLDVPITNTPRVSFETKNVTVSEAVSNRLVQSLLPTVQLRIICPSGETTQIVRALCDSGSETNLITHDCIQRLSLRYIPAPMVICGIGGSTVMTGIGYIDLPIQHREREQTLNAIRLIIVPKITTRLPSQQLQNYFEQEITGWQLADPCYWVPGKIDVLLGAGVWAQIVSVGIIRKTIVGGASLLAQNTIFGWIIFGHTNQKVDVGLTLHLTSPSDNESTEFDTVLLDTLIRRFWEIESIPERHFRTADEQKAEDNFIQTYTRSSSGRFVVTIPFRNDVPPLGNSRNTALKQFLHLENRFKTNPRLAEEYNKFIEDYLKSGHLIRAPPPPADCSKSYYIPYHAITKRKFRFVFNASCPTTTGISLNQMQLPGEKRQDDLCGTLLRFRMPKYALVGDIIQMFRQIQVARDHWEFQRILLRLHPNGPVEEFYITIVVWGMVSALFNAVRSLQEHAIQQRKVFPEAAKATLEDFYVDNMLTGRNTAKKLIELYDQIIKMLYRAGFRMSQWATNNSELAAIIGQYSMQPVKRAYLA